MNELNELTLTIREKNNEYKKLISEYKEIIKRLNENVTLKKKIRDELAQLRESKKKLQKQI